MLKKIYILAGEASGDLHGANLIRHLRTESSTPLEIYGVGGDRIKETGVRNFFDLAHFHVTGFTEAVKRLPQYKQAARTILQDIRDVRPDLVVLIDNPGFNFHIAEKVHALGIPIVYYISPQLWAWAPKRIFKMKRFAKKVLVVFEFEKKLYEDHGIPVAWVGHPLKDLVQVEAKPETVRTSWGLKEGQKLVALLPGSRKSELEMLFDVFMRTAQLISERLPDTAFALIKSPTLPRAFYEELLKKYKVQVRLVEENSYAVIRASDLALACSGTATLECALLETPLMIAYKSTLVTFLIAKTLVKVPFVGLPNLILGEKRIPEFLQYNATPEKISQSALELLTDPAALKNMREELKKVSRNLGEGGANQKAAIETLKVLSEL